jgi:hypothetical protein
MTRENAANALPFQYLGCNARNFDAYDANVDADMFSDCMYVWM